MENENPSGNVLPGDAQLTASGTAPTVGNVANPAPVAPTASGDSLTLTELNAYLGKDFKDKDSALKSFKDTFAYVGKKRDDIVREVAGDTSGLAKELAQIKENMFFEKNKDYAPYRNLIGKLGNNPETVVQSQEFKEIFEKAKGFDQSQTLRTVLESNPRIASSRDKLTQGAEALRQGNTEQAESLVTRAVLESIE